MSSENIAIKVKNLSKCYHIYDNPRDRLKQLVAPRLQRMTWQNLNNIFGNFGRLRTFPLKLKKVKPLGLLGVTAVVNPPYCK